VIAVRDRTRGLIKRAIDSGDWLPYEAQLCGSAVNYARVGLTFEGWYVLTVCIADVVTPHMIAAYGSEPHRLGEALRVMRRFLDPAVQTVRRLATNLRPDILDDLGLLAALEWQAREVEARSGIRFDLALPEEEIDAPEDQATAIFRIFQEILTNVVRHARAKN